MAILLGFAAASHSQPGADLGQMLPQQGSSQRGLGISDVNTGSVRGGSSGLPGTDINSLLSDRTPYVTDYPLMDSLYVVGPGDVFQLHYEASSLEKQVTPEGDIFLNRIGAVHVDGLTLRAAKKRILDKLATAFKRSDCFVGLSRPKTMRVFVTGAVNTPGTHEIPGNFRLSDALKIAGGFSAAAQKGVILITTEDTVLQVNLRGFLMEGDLSSNPYLPQGAVIHVPYVDYSRPWVTIRRNAESFATQMEPGETLADAVFKSYSFTSPTPYSALLVRDFNGLDTLIAASEAIEYKPSSGAYVEIIPARQEIFVAGAVAGPGLQPHVSNRKVIQYISTAGLLTSSKVPRKIEVIRANGTRLSLPIQSADLHPGDVLFVRQNAEQKFLIYTPIVLSLVSLSLTVITVFSLY
jgi:protein involved in polysaccharide export with SLBB domain